MQPIGWSCPAARCWKRCAMPMQIYFFAIQYKLSRQEWMANQLVYTMQAARWRRVLGRADPVMTPYESGLAAALSPEKSAGSGTAESRNFIDLRKIQPVRRHCAPESSFASASGRLLAKLATKAMPTQMIKTDRVTVEHSSSVDAVGGGLAVDKRRAHITLKQNAAQDRAYIEAASAALSTRRNGCARLSRSFVWATIWGAICGSVPVCPARSRLPHRKQSIWLNRPNCRPTATALITPKIGNCTAVWCCGLPSRSATASLCTSSPTPVLPAAAT